MIGIGGFVLFYFFAGINIEGFSGGFIKGTIAKPHLVSSFLCLFFIYNFFMFYVYLSKEIERFNFTADTLRSFGVAISKFIIKREIGKILQASGFGHITDNEYEPKNFSAIGTKSEREIKTQFTIDPETRNSHEKEIEKLPGFEFDIHAIIFTYEISDDDERFYNENKDLLRRAVTHEFMDYIFPKYFGSFVLIAIFVEAIRVILTR